MKNIIYTILIIILAACSTARVHHTEPVAQVDWSEYKTFDLQIPEERLVGVPTEKMLTLRSAVANEMKKRGFTESSENADLVVNLDLVFEDKIQTRQTNIQTDPINYIGQRRFHWRVEEKEVGRYKEGTISLNLVDADTQESVWKASIHDRVPPTEKRIERLVQEGVNALFSNFPVNRLDS
ncbi:hypothetical protein BH23BAC1_BH23BAC1_39000 [soil metagenome]